MKYKNSPRVGIEQYIENNMYWQNAKADSTVSSALTFSNNSLKTVSSSTGVFVQNSGVLMPLEIPQYNSVLACIDGVIEWKEISEC